MKRTLFLRYNGVAPFGALALLSVVGLSGCGGGKEQFAGNGTNSSGNVASNTGAGTGPREEPPSQPGKYGGTLTDDALSDPKTFNYWVAAETSSTGAVGILYDSLVGRNLYTLEFEDRLAEMPKISQDGRTYTFTLKPNLKWSDGHPITADDVTFTLDTIYDTKVQSNMRESMLLDAPDGKGGFKRVPLKYRKVDERTVEMQFPVPYAPALSILNFPIAPRHKLYAAWKEGQPNSTRFNSTWGVNVNVQELVGNGPFLLQQYVPGQRLVYKRNPNYWKKDDQNRPLPYLDRLVTLIVPDTNASTLKFRSGATDVLGIQHTDYPLIKREESKGNYKVVNLGPTWGNNFVCFNQNPRSVIARRKPKIAKLFRDVRFRRAVSHAINRQRLVDTVFQGFAGPMYAPESPANALFYNPDVPKYEYDPKKAQALLQEIGLRDTNGNKYLEAGGQEVKFSILTNASNKLRVAMLTIITNDLRKVGLNATFTPIDFNKMISLLDAKPEPGKAYPPYDWDAVMLGFTGGPEPNDGRNIWSSSGNLHQWNPYQERPATSWEKEIDDIFRQGAQELDETKRKALYARWQAITAEQLPLIYTVVPDGLVALRNKYGNIKQSSFGVTWNIEEIYDLSATRNAP